MIEYKCLMISHSAIIVINLEMIACSTIMISTFPYYGGRFYQLKEILGILGKHREQFEVIVDVFGDPGKC